MDKELNNNSKIGLPNDVYKTVRSDYVLRTSSNRIHKAMKEHVAVCLMKRFRVTVMNFTTG